MDENVALNQSIRPGTHDDCTYKNLFPEYDTMMDDETNNTNEDLKGLRLILLLMAAAEALTGANKCRELATVILVRLKGLVSPNDGTNMERLAPYFTDALQGLLDGTAAKQVLCGGGGLHHYKDEHHRTDVLAAFQLALCEIRTLHRQSGYIRSCRPR